MKPVDWVIVPAGTLVRGTPCDAIDDVVQRHSDLGLPRHFFAKEAPRTEVAVGAFRIARTPVTWDLWNAFCIDVGRTPTAEAPTDHPVGGVGWVVAVEFCSWFASMTSDDVRLPTETEWERCARGDDDREYPWGNRFDALAANLSEARIGATTAVGSFPRGVSPFGILDLAGNVDEWTSTEYAPYPGSPPDVPCTEPWALDHHVTRGGSFLHHRDLARCARRHGVYPPLKGAGFRLAAGVLPAAVGTP